MDVFEGEVSKRLMFEESEELKPIVSRFAVILNTVFD